MLASVSIILCTHRSERYEEKDAIAAGGLLLPKWVTKKPKFLPEEYYRLIGATHKGFPEEVTEVRNTFGSNLSFKADVLKALGGFRGEMGVRGKGLLQGESMRTLIVEGTDMLDW